MVTATPQQHKSDRLGWDIGIVGSIIAPATLASSLMLYFGWVRTNALFGYFGVDPALLGFSLQDYGLRAAGVAFKPAVFAATIAFILIAFGRFAVAIDRLLAKCLSSRRPACRIQPILVAEFTTSIFVIGATIQSLLDESPPVDIADYLGLSDPLVNAVALTCAAVVLLHALRRLTQHGNISADTVSPFVRQSKSKATAKNLAVLKILAFALAILGIFWATAVKAQRDGYQLAEAINSYPGYQSTVTVMSNGPLQALEAVSRPPSGDSGKVIRYPGLHLLSYAGGRWFLLTNSRSANGRLEVAILRDSDIAGAIVVGAT